MIFSTQKRRWFYSALLFGISMGLWFSRGGNWSAGVESGFFCGIFFATFCYVIAVWQMKRLSRSRPDFDGEAVTYEGPANHFKGTESVGGFLWLTSGRLFFRSHRLNIQNHEWSVRLGDVESVEAVKTLFLVPGGLQLGLSSGAVEHLVVSRNGNWAAAISSAMAAAKGDSARSAGV